MYYIMPKRDITLILALVINILLFSFLIFNIFNDNLTLNDVLNYTIKT